MTGSSPVCRIGTRSSNLALIQARHSLAEFGRRCPGTTFELVPFDSPGDRDRQTDLRVSPADFFTRDLDDAVRSGAIDGAIHSAKDVPDPVSEGLDWCWLPWREDPRDALVIPQGTTLAGLPAAPRIGVSSERREAYCRQRFPDGRFLPIRGNIEHRLAQLDAGDFDLLVMAVAALERLELADRTAEHISLADLPVPEGQGVLCLTFRAGDSRMQRLRSLFVRSVVFAGAGVGTTGQVTQDVTRALAACDICFHDTLIPAGILSLVSPRAVVVNVGKRSGRHSAKQQEINQLLADACRKGQRVVRLKGGDPGIFGRLGEELDTLDALALPHRILPGLSALNAVAPASGILLTERGTSRGLTVLTPRQEGGDVALPDRDTRDRFPIVAYMAVKACGQVCADLLSEGWPPGTPAAMVFGAGCPEGFTIRGILATLPAQVAATETALPGLLVIGDAAGRQLASHGPLDGRRVLLTCSDALQEKTAQRVLDFGGTPLSFPLIRLVPATTLPDLAGHDWLVVTSPSAVRCFLDALAAQRIDVRTLPRLAVCGPGSAEALAAHRLFPDLCARRDFGTEGLVCEFAATVPAGARVLRLRSDKAGDVLAEELRAKGYLVTDWVCYRNEPVAVDALPEFDDVVFASASAAEVFLERWGTAALAGRTIACIGQPTRQALLAQGIAPDAVGLEATMDGCIEALAAYHVNRALAAPASREEILP